MYIVNQKIYGEAREVFGHVIDIKVYLSVRYWSEDLIRHGRKYGIINGSYQYVTCGHNCL